MESVTLPESVTALQGAIEAVEGDRITGWARDPNAPGTPVRLLVTDHGAALGAVVARQYRADLAIPGVNHGCHGFEFTVPGGLSLAVGHSIEIRCVSDGRFLPGPPFLLPAAPRAPELRGRLDNVTRKRIAGWAQDAGSDDPVMLAILDNGAVLARVLANLHRQDLQAAGVGSGRHGFELMLPGGLSPLERHVIAVQREADGAPLPFSPMVIDAPSSFGAMLEQALTTAVDQVPPGSEQSRMLAFLMAQTERLRQRSADADGQRAGRRAWLDRHRHGSLQTGTCASAPGLRALVIDAALPVAGRDAGSAAVLSHMAALQHLGYSLTLTVSDDTGSASPALAASGIELCAAPFYFCVEEVLRRQADCFDIVYLRHAVIAARYLDLARRYQPRARILVCLPELRHRLLARQADAQANSALLAASWRFHTMECHAALSADAMLTHSSEEATLLRRAVPPAALHRVPWHVPLLAGRPALAKRRGIAFIAHFGHKANVDAAIWLAETIMPLVWERLPGLACLLAGSAMPAAVRNLARPGITPLFYAEDLASVFDQVRVTVAPMRFGAGVNGKALGSLAAGVPCVMTPLAAEGLALPDTIKKMVAPDAPGLARLICDYHQDLAANRAASRAGLSLIRKDWSAAAVTTALQAAL